MIHAGVRADERGIALTLGKATYPLTLDDATVLWAALSLALCTVSGDRLAAFVRLDGLRSFAGKCMTKAIKLPR